MTLTSPIRNPDLRNPSVMTRRAWWLIVLSVFIPGSAQLLAGNRSLGRFLFGSWLAMVGTVIVGFLLNTFATAFALTVATSWWGLVALQVGLVYVAIVWFIAAVDTFRLVRFVHVGQRAKGWVALAVILSIVVPSGVASYASFLSGVSRGALANIFADQAEIVEPIDGVYTFLLIGGDAGKNRISRRTDSMSFATVDATTGQVTIVGLPRNLYNAPFIEGSPMLRDWPDGFNCGDDCLLAYVYTYGLDHPDMYPGIGSNTDAGVEALRDSIEAIVGMPVQFYVGIDMAGFSDLVDALGGVDITLDAPVNVCKVGEPITYTFEPGTIHMDGKLALRYARTRCDTNDYDRMARQRDLEAAIFKQVKPSVIVARFQELASVSTSLIKTDVPQSMVGIFLDLAQKGRKLPIQREELVPPKFGNVYPDWNLSKQLVHDAVFPESTD
ncbi:MAG: LCP family protein [Microbacteriaceae bacterium]